MAETYEKRARKKRKEQKRREKAKQKQLQSEQGPTLSDEELAARYLDLPEEDAEQS